MLLSDWYCWKLELTDLPGHDSKMTPDKTVIPISHQRHKGGHRDYCSHFSGILWSVCDWTSKQQLNLVLFLPDCWFCRKLGLTDLPGHNGKVTPDKKIISIPYEGYKDGNRDYCSHFSVTFEATGKFLIAFVRLILGKVGVDGFTGHIGKVTTDMNLIWR